MKRCPSCHSTLPSDYTHCPRDGTPLLSIADWREGSLIRGKYRILAKIGEGGMATVYKASHTRFNELRALKVISPALASDAGFVRRFEQEAIFTRKLQHPNAVRVDDIDEADDGRPFIVMEYVEGRSLKEVIEQEAPMSVTRVCSIVEQAVAALDAAHAVGLVHRDIKPGNIALISSPDGLASEGVKILDFGIAKLKEAQIEDSKTHSRLHLTMTDTGMLIGTPAYMSPEQARGMRGDQLDGRSDLYSLGIVMYQMLTGELPLKADSTIEQLMAHINTPPQPIDAVRPELSRQVASAVMRCLEKNRDLRPANGQALIRELQMASSGATSILAAPPIAQAKPALRPAEQATASSITFKAPEMEETAATVLNEAVPISNEPVRSIPSRVWLWSGLLASLLAAGGMVAYFSARRNESPSPPASSSGSDARPGGVGDQKQPVGENAGETNPSAQPRSTVPKPENPAAQSAPPTPKTTPPATNAAEKSAILNPAATIEKKSPQASSAPVPAPTGISKQMPAVPGDSEPSTDAKVDPSHVRPSPDVQAGSLISRVDPVYPPLARQARIQGTVTLKAVIGKDGSVKNVEVMDGHPMLAPAAIDAVKQWKYTPSTLNNEAVEVATPIQINFELAKNPQPAETSSAEAPSSQVYRVGAGVSAPSIISSTQPDYTDEARRARRQGTCVLTLIVDTTGQARNIRVVSPLGFGLDEKAVAAVQQWRFRPGMKDGKPVNVELNIDVEFRQY